jgi:hypothetical protein
VPIGLLGAVGLCGHREQRKIDQRAPHREIAVVHHEIAAHAVLVQLEADAILRRLLAIVLGLVEIGDVHRPEPVRADARQNGFFSGSLSAGVCLLPMTTVVVITLSASSEPSNRLVS